MALGTRDGWKPPCAARIAALSCAPALIIVLLGTCSTCRFGQLSFLQGERSLREQAGALLSIDLRDTLVQKSAAPVAPRVARADPQAQADSQASAASVGASPAAHAPPAMHLPELRPSPALVPTSLPAVAAQAQATAREALPPSTSTRAPAPEKPLRHRGPATEAAPPQAQARPQAQATSTGAPAPSTSSTVAPAPRKNTKKGKPSSQKAGEFGTWRAGQSKTWAETCKPYPGKRVVLVQANAQYTEMFRNWLFHASRFWNPKTDQLVIAAESKSSEVVFKELSGLFGVHWDVQFLGSSGEDEKARSSYGGGVWTKVVNHRPLQVLELLEQGCSVLYSDIDIVWIRPIFAELDAAGQFDAYIANDAERIHRMDLCTCTMYFHPTPANKDLMTRWAAALKGQSKNQGAFNGVVTRMNREKSISYHKLSQLTFPMGKQAEANKATAVALHANYMRGAGTKVNFLKKLGYWNPEGNVTKRVGGL